MRQNIAGTNRAWLAAFGLLLLVAGAVGTAIGTGLWLPATTAAGLGIDGPRPDRPVLGSGVGSWIDQTGIIVGLAAVGVLLAVLGLVWLLAQIPRVNAARPFRLSDETSRGLTVCDPAVLTAAVESDLLALPGVTAASAVLRGTASRPELSVRLAASDGTDLQELIQAIRTEVVAHLTTARKTPLRQLAVQFDLTGSRRSSDRVVLA